MNIRYFFTLCVFGLFVYLPFILQAQTNAEMLKDLVNAEGRVDFYGRFVDQNEQPVEGVKVTCELKKTGMFSSGRSDCSVKTDKDGYFELHKGKAAAMYIYKAEKEGYEYRWNKNPHSFEYRQNYAPEYRHHPDKTKPVVFHIRRREDEAVMILERKMYMRIMQDENKSWIGGDWAIGWSEYRAQREKLEKDGCFWDIEMEGRHNEEDKSWTVTLKVNGENAGLQLSDKLLYMAPETGYEKEITLTFQYSRELPLKYIYLRLREPGMYTRIDVSYAQCSADMVKIEGDVYINPYGDRCLEECEFTANYRKMYYEYREAGFDAMKAQKLAERPDFKQLMKEGKIIYRTH